MSLGGSCVLSLNYRSERTFHSNDVQINVVVLYLGYVQVDVLSFSSSRLLNGQLVPKSLVYNFVILQQKIFLVRTHHIRSI